MPETQPTPQTTDPAACSRRREEYVLNILLDVDNHRPIAIEELVCEIGDYRDAIELRLCKASAVLASRIA